MAWRSNYWSCSKFADRIRGTAKPHALGLEEWDEWTEAAKKAHPFRYWLADTALNKLQDIIYFPRTVYRSIDGYLDNRFVVKTHCLTSDLKKGHWYDMDTRILHSLFGGLVQFVEMELSGMNRIGKGKKPRYSRKDGLEYLDWEIGLTYEDEETKEAKPTPQAESAKEVKRLYLWWKDERPKRQDPWDLVGEDPLGDPDKLEYREKYGAMDDLEKKYEEEDTQAMISLIKLRGGMWT
jgi:hypothetical protein